MGCSLPKRQLRGGDMTVAVPPAARPSCIGSISGGQRSAEERGATSSPAEKYPFLSLRAAVPAGLLGARLGPAAAPGRSIPKPPGLRGKALPLGADTESRFPSLRLFPLNKIVFRVAREAVKPRYYLIHM